MATSNVVIVVRATNTSATEMNKKYFRGSEAGANGKLGARQGIHGLLRLLQAVLSRVVRGTVYCTVLDDAGTKPTSTIACVQANASGNYVRWTYGGQTITLTEGASTDGFARGASDTTCGAALATAINAHKVLGRLYTAAADTGTVTLTPKIPTQLYHDVALSTDDATAFVLTQATGGTEGAAQFFLREFFCGGV
jgi:hypothetical protein